MRRCCISSAIAETRALTAADRSTVACAHAAPSLRLTPHGHLVLEQSADAPELDERIASRLTDAFARGSGHGLLRLGAGEVGQALPPLFVWWRGFAARYVGALCLQSSGSGVFRTSRRPAEADLASLVLTAPMMPARSISTPDVLRALWQEIAAALAASLGRREDRPAELSEEPEPRLEPGRTRALQPGREPPRRRRAVRLPRHLHDAALGAGAGAARAARPGAARVRRRGQPRHSCCRCCCRCSAPPRPAPGCGRWSTRASFPSAALDAARGRRACSPACRTWSAPASSCACRRPGAPTARRARRSPAPSARASPRRSASRACWTSAWTVTLDGETLSGAGDRRAAVGHRLAGAAARPVGGDRSRAARALDPAVPRGGATGGARGPDRSPRRCACSPAPRSPMSASDVAVADWSQRDGRAVAGRDAAQACARPMARGADPRPALHGTLRPYQHAGVQWLHLLSGLGLGACLADDMGLGKTIQVLALLLARNAARGPSLLVAPASLLANWAAEIEKFAPDLQHRDRASVGDDRGGDRRIHRRRMRPSSIWRSPATARCCASRRCRRSSGASPSSTRRRRSRTRTPSRRARRRR